MAVEADDLVPLPPAPPPRPAARKDALEAALRKFDGIEDEPTRATNRAGLRWPTWATIDQRTAGAFATVAVLLLASLPLALGTVRERLPETVGTGSEATATRIARPDVTNCTGSDCASKRAVVAEAAGPLENSPAHEHRTRIPTAAGRAKAPVPSQVAVVNNDHVPTKYAAPPMAVAAAAPPPPAPYSEAQSPYSEAQSRSGETESQLAETVEGDAIVVTGARAALSQSKAASSDYAARQSSPRATINRTSDFLSDLQAAIRANDRRAVATLTATPLRVNIDGRTVIYRSAQEVERDFDRIFTPAVKSSVLTHRRVTNGIDGDRRLKVGRILIDQLCSTKACKAGSPLRIKEVTP